jgi:hypothetical protein
LKVAILFFLILNLSPVLASQDTAGWNIEKSTHFLVYYKNSPGYFIRELIEQSEDYYNKIADDLGFTRFNFWLWDNRAKIYIYDDQSDYQTATAQPSWSAGSAAIREKTIYTFLRAKGFFETTLPHEMGHIIFREFVGFDNPAVPLWLDEGVASYQQKTKYSLANKFLVDAVNKESFIPLDKLSGFSSTLSMDNSLAQLFYAESFSIIDFLIREFDKDKFVLFCQNLRDKKDLSRAIALSYPFSNLGELDKAWQEHLRNE